MNTFLAVIIVLVSVGIVSWPLLRRTLPDPSDQGVDPEVAELLARKDTAIFTINELESDYALGSLSPSDYRKLKNKYEERALALIKTVDELKGGPGAQETIITGDEIPGGKPAPPGIREIEADIEAKVLAMRRVNTEGDGRKLICRDCGARLDAGALFCSRCDHPLGLKCPGCSAVVGADDAFCSRCGTALQTNS